MLLSHDTPSKLKYKKKKRATGLGRRTKKCDRTRQKNKRGHMEKCEIKLIALRFQKGGRHQNHQLPFSSGREEEARTFLLMFLAYLEE